MPSATAVHIDMGLRHHLNDFVSQEEGDNKPTAYAVAQKSGLALNTVYRLCADPEKSMGWAVIAKLCAALRIQPGDLLTFDFVSEQGE